VKLAPIPRVV